MNFVDVESRFRPGQLIRYAYSGLILLVLAVWLEPERIGPVLEDLGVFLTAMVVGVVGIAAYVLYKELLGEFLLYPARHMLHTAAAKAVHRARQGRAPEAGSVGSVPALLGSLGVPIGQRQWVYRSLRTTTLLSEPQKRSLDLFHSEIHVLYISAVELLAAGAYGATTQKPVAWAFWLAGALLVSAYIIDWRMDFLDAAFMRNQRIAVSKALEELGFPKRGV